MSDAAAAQLSEHAGEAANLSEPADDAAAPALVHLSLDALSTSGAGLILATTVGMAVARHLRK